MWDDAARCGWNSLLDWLTETWNKEGLHLMTLDVRTSLAGREEIQKVGKTGLLGWFLMCDLHSHSICSTRRPKRTSIQKSIGKFTSETNTCKLLTLLVPVTLLGYNHWEGFQVPLGITGSQNSRGQRVKGGMSGKKEEQACATNQDVVSSDNKGTRTRWSYKQAVLKFQGIDNCHVRSQRKMPS
jgi:hypothetical protein